MRYRKIDRFTPGPTMTFYNNDIGALGTNTVTVRNNSLKVGETIETWDLVTPHFRARQRAGELFVNPYRNRVVVRGVTGDYTSWRKIAANGDGSHNNFHTDGPYFNQLLAERDGLLSEVSLFPTSEIDSLLDQSATKAWSDALVSKAQGLVFIAEMRKTLDLLRHPLRNFSRFLVKVRKDKANRGGLSKSASVAEYLAKEWLTYRFGVRPLLSDMESIIKAVGKGGVSGKRRALGVISKERAQTIHRTFGASDDLKLYDDIVTHRIIVRSGFHHMVQVSLPDLLGLSVKNIPEAAWELIPFSFVVDWFFNVGDWARSLIPNATVSTIAPFTTVEHSFTRVLVLTGYTYSAPLFTLLRVPSGAENLYVRERSRNPGIRAPSLSRKMLFSDISISDLRILDAIALIHQQLKSK